MPPVPAAGVPLSTPVPAVKVTPPGRAPVSLKVGAGKPVAATVKLPAVPTVNVVLLALVMAGAWLIVRVKLWVAFVPTPLVAVKVSGYVPPVPAAGVPLKTPVATLKVRPRGSVPVSLKVGAGKPVAVTVNEPAVPTVNVVLLALVMAGAWLIVRVKLWVAFVPTPLVAVKVSGYVPPVPAAGVPLSTPVATLNVTPPGNVPVSLRVGVGKPVAVTVNEPAVPTVNVVLLALVMAGAWKSVGVRGWGAFVHT